MLLELSCLMFAVGIWYLYDGYLRALTLLGRWIKGAEPNHARAIDRKRPTVTVLVAAHNEQNTIVKRIENILKTSYQADKIEVIVASDGSTDATNALVMSYPDQRVRLVPAGSQIGKTSVQNVAVKEARGEILIFSDADTRFDVEFIERILAPFSDAGVGAVDGHLLFEAEDGNCVAAAQGFYWKYELALRAAESRLGILAVASGACLAVRKTLIREMDPAIGEDCIVPLDVVEQGYRVVHCSEARAYDRMENQPDREFRVRVRMTLRNWQGTWSRPSLLNPVRHFGIAWALWSHKIVRWLSPFLLLGFLATANQWALRGDTFGLLAAAAIDGLLMLSLVGWLGSQLKISIPLAGTAYSFVLANAGFLIGVLKAWTGKTINIYKKA